MATPDTIPSAAQAALNRFYEAEMAYLAAGGPAGGASFDGMAATLHPDVVMHQAAGLPYGGEWTGHEGVERFFTAMSETWSSLEVTDTEFLTTDDTVAIVLRLRARSRATGREVDMPMVHVVRIQDDLIRDFRPFYWDTAEVAAACG
ncbi:nuclear transport factor 2 family protein [Pseudonocardia kujensis]|uniref:nuclear transport factor 2 family protein n=1 Tax=Pseudonocardia kujensis TaxID=1128675 RepID=UPI001E2ACF02|nr:nuclear transport factor 2 family protein [Pseudonocardia kujensis]MCE0764919.1 nuclear transport factor 2 family protein [Pseudonocardia kujensis]